jgi:hypothetical protein
MSARGERQPSAEECARAAATCEGLLVSLRELAPRDDAILDLARDIEEARLEALRLASAAGQPAPVAPPAGPPPARSAARN